MNKIICIGSSTKDMIFPINDGEIIETPNDLEAQKKIVFELGAKYQVSGKRHKSLGGCAANVACGLARLGVESYCCTRVGDDQSAEWIIDELKKNNVKTDLVQVGKNYKSDLSFILAHAPSEDRVVFSDRDSNEKLEILIEEIEKVGANWIFVSSLNGNEEESWEDKLDKTLQLIKEDVKLIFNPGQKNIKKDPQKIIQAVSQSKILIVNKDEAIEIASKAGEFSDDQLNDEKFLAEKLKALGAKIVAITDGARGAWAFNGNEFLYSEIKKVEIVDTLGAGDAFSSGFIAAYIKGKELKECLNWGIANSSGAVGFYGAIEGLLKENEINKLQF